MWAGLPFAILIAAMILLIFFGERESIAGLTPPEIAGLGIVLALGIPFFHRIRAEYGGRWAKGMQALAFWIGAILLIVGLHSYRFELSAVAHRVLGSLMPGAAIATRDGEATITRQDGGSFIVNGRINGVATRFIFDTGASAVVLTHEDARRAGLRIAESDYVVQVWTANGPTMTARAQLDEMTIGPIRETAVRALAARPGALRESLLGMTFLERLASYRVEGDRLILRSR